MEQNLTYIFCHGLSGWGSYDAAYKRMPYWGMRGGDLMAYLRKEGFDCFAASVAPSGSAWDRACELYAQIAGVRVDYGAAHSKRYHHGRFGRDFTGNALIPEWNDDTRLVLLGHSFGGVTVRLLSELLANGDPKELEDGAPDISPLFKGGLEDRVHSIVTLAAPTNGTTAYDLSSDPDFHQDEIPVPWWSKILGNMMSKGTKPHEDGRDPEDYAQFDMHVDNALSINQRITTLPGVYYFSVPCSFSEKQKDGTYRPKKKIEPHFVRASSQIGAYKGKTEGGFILDENWRENDGLVNTYSAMYPIGAPSKPLDKEHIEQGMWNIYPTLDGDHMWPQGGLVRKHDIKAFYLEMLKMINGLKK